MKLWVITESDSIIRDGHYAYYPAMIVKVFQNGSNCAIASFINHDGKMITSEIIISNMFDTFDEAIYAADHYFDDSHPVFL